MKLVGYNVAALNHTLSGKLPADLTCPIPEVPLAKTPKKLRIIRRCTLIFSDPSQNHRLASLANAYDILALRPTSEKAFLQACNSVEYVSLISLDLTQRHAFYFKPKVVSTALARGIRFELCYSQGILATDSMSRRNLISNATQLIRATRGKGIILSSESSKAIGLRAPMDVINLATVWGLSQERGREAVEREARAVIVKADFMRTSYKGAVNVISGAFKKSEGIISAKGAGKLEGQRKRKYDGDGNGEGKGDGSEGTRQAGGGSRASAAATRARAQAISEARQAGS